MRYTNSTETTKSLEALKFKGGLFLKSSDRLLKETVTLSLWEYWPPLDFLQSKTEWIGQHLGRYLSGSTEIIDLVDINIKCPTSLGCILSVCGVLHYDPTIYSEELICELFSNCQEQKRNERPDITATEHTSEHSGYGFLGYGNSQTLLSYFSFLVFFFSLFNHQ